MPFSGEIISGNDRIGIWRIDGTEHRQAQKYAGIGKELAARHPRTQLQRISSRLLTAEMIGDFPRIEKDSHGRPLLPDLPWDISISHTRGYAAVMLGKGRLGVDVQHYKPNVMKVRDRFLDSREVKMAPDIGTATLLWAAKEAVYKFNARPGLDFRGPIAIRSIEKDTMPCTFRFGGCTTELLLHWKELHRAMLVWTGMAGNVYL